MSDIVVKPIEKIKKKCLCCGEEARNLFVDALVDFILNKEDKVYWNYL